MLSSAAGKTASFTETQVSDRRKSSLISRKIWLPRLLYSALPGFYIGSGIAAFLATLYINQWFWILPHYTLFSFACVHLGLIVYRKRRRHSSEQA
jgi:hypothetical protein